MLDDAPIVFLDPFVITPNLFFLVNFILSTAYMSFSDNFILWILTSV